jgi:hypothetical protein
MARSLHPLKTSQLKMSTRFQVSRGRGWESSVDNLKEDLNLTRM